MEKEGMNMDHLSKFYHHGNKIIGHDIIDDILSTIDAASFSFDLYNATTIRKGLTDCLIRKGWITDIKVDPVSDIRITAKKKTCGLCIQLGNVCRMYADLMKLQAMYIHGEITSGILIVPTQNASKKLCKSNMVYYERLISEMEIFNEIITIPLAIIGFEE